MGLIFGSQKRGRNLSRREILRDSGLELCRFTIVLYSFVPPNDYTQCYTHCDTNEWQVNTLRVLIAYIPVSHSTHSNVLSEPLVPWILSVLGDWSSTQLQWSARRWHQASILWKGTAELPPFWDSWTVVRGIRGIFTVSVASEVEFSQVLIKLIVPLLFCSLTNLIPTSEEVKLERSFC